MKEKRRKKMNRRTKRKLNRFGWKVHTAMCNLVGVVVIFGIGFLFWIAKWHGVKIQCHARLVVE